MNVFLKAIIKELADIESLGLDIAGKKNLQLILSDTVQAAMDATEFVANVQDFIPELTNLVGNPSADADLLSYATTTFGGNSSKAQAIIGACASLALNLGIGIASVVAAIKAP